ncbi:MAG: cysteine rich repeat-containing protein [Myxococcota bacterium]|nr:cysteine rich repeat-containing protein [Myxococcota bacterium]
MKRLAWAVAIVASFGIVAWMGIDNESLARGGAGDGACREDAERFCADVERGEGRVAACLLQNEAQLSADCQAKVQTVKTRIETAEKACSTEISQFCSGMERGPGLAACLREHREQLSSGCSDELKAMRADVGRHGGKKGDRGKGVHKVCAEDAQRLCDGITGKAERMACLVSNKGSLSTECAAKVELIETRYAEAVAACGSDAASFCPGMEPGSGLFKCMSENREKLSAGCQAHMDEQGWGNKASRKAGKGKKAALQESCSADIQSLCKQVEPGEGRIRDCLRENSASLSASCKEAIENRGAGKGDRAKKGKKDKKDKKGKKAKKGIDA